MIIADTIRKLIAILATVAYVVGFCFAAPTLLQVPHLYYAYIYNCGLVVAIFAYLHPDGSGWVVPLMAGPAYIGQLLPCMIAFLVTGDYDSDAMYAFRMWGECIEGLEWEVNGFVNHGRIEL